MTPPLSCWGASLPWHQYPLERGAGGYVMIFAPSLYIAIYPTTEIERLTLSISGASLADQLGSRGNSDGDVIVARGKQLAEGEAVYRHRHRPADHMTSQQPTAVAKLHPFIGTL